MPNRILREGILTSRRVNALKPQAEVFYRRLMSVVDDFGRYSADPALLRSSCFPRRLDEVREADISRWLAEAQTAGLIALYAVGEEPYLELLDFRQQVRAKASKFPPPPADVLRVGVTCVADAKHMHPKTETKTETKTRGESGATDAPPAAPASPAQERRPSPSALLEAWEENRGSLPAVKDFGPERRRKAELRLARIPDIGRWAAAFRRAAGTPFCRGENDRGWRATFDWFLKPESLPKLEEGKYDPPPGRGGPPDDERRKRSDERRRKELEAQARANAEARAILAGLNPEEVPRA